MCHLFVIEINDGGEIALVTAFCNNVDWQRQQGKETID